MSVQTLNLAQCKEYIKNIKDLEISCYQQERILQELKRLPSVTKKNISELNHQLQTEKAPPRPISHIFDLIMNFVFNAFFSLIGALIGGGIGLILRIIIGIFNSGVNLFSSPWLPYIFWGAVIGYIINFVICIYVSKDIIKEAISARKNYPKKIESFQKKQEEIKDLIERKKKNLETVIPRETEAMEEVHQQTRNLLKSYYDMGFIYPKYRSLVPICTLYEYLESGRCFSLLGHEGAYNLYENELRMNAIIGKLDDVVARLDDISANQRLLAKEIRQSNAQLSRISNTLDNIENNTALTQYYSSVTASNTTFMSWLTALSYDEQKRDK